jgi:hypothetical protein
MLTLSKELHGFDDDRGRMKLPSVFQILEEPNTPWSSMESSHEKYPSGSLLKSGFAEFKEALLSSSYSYRSGNYTV